MFRVIILLLVACVAPILGALPVEQSLDQCIVEYEQAFINFKIPASIEAYTRSLRKANPRIERLSDVFKVSGLRLAGVLKKPSACRDLVEDLLEIQIGIPCYYVYGQPRSEQLAAFKEAKANSLILERIFGSALACAL